MAAIEVGQDLGDPRPGVLHAREADLEHGEAGLHEEDEYRRHQQPDRVEDLSGRELSLVVVLLERRRVLGEREGGEHEQGEQGQWGAHS